MSSTGTIAQVMGVLSIRKARAQRLVRATEVLYVDKMKGRFSRIRVAERLKRTNPFLAQIRGVKTVQEWAELQVQSTLFASEEEAVGHVLEMIAKACHPKARKPTYPDDFDFEVSDGRDVQGYQVKMSWDCMPMSSRKNLSNTIRRMKKKYQGKGIVFTGYFAPCYGRAKTSSPPGQDYITLASRAFWKEVGNGDNDFDVKVGEVVALLCANFRLKVTRELLPTLVSDLVKAAEPLIGDGSGKINYTRLFRQINK